MTQNQSAQNDGFDSVKTSIGFADAVKIDNSPGGPSYQFKQNDGGMWTLQHRYVPQPLQAMFHASTAFHRLFDGGMGAGKTRTACEELTRKHLYFPGAHSMIYGASYDSIRDTVLPVLFEEITGLPGDKYSLVTNYNEQKKIIQWYNGGMTHIRSADQPMKLKSFNLLFAYIEEMSEVTEYSFNMLKTRLRMRGPWRGMWGNSNPEGHDWVWRKFYYEPSQNKHLRKDYFVVTVPTKSNIHLPPEYLKIFDDMPHEMIMRYREGSRDDYVGNIYQIRKRDHVLREGFISKDHPHPGWAREIGIDWGHRNPCAVVFNAIDYRGNIIAHDEIYEKGLIPSQVATIIHKKLRAYGLSASDPNVKFRIDPAALQTEYDGKRVMDLFREAGIPCYPANNAVEAGIMRVKTYLERSFTASDQYLTSIGRGKESPLSSDSDPLQAMPPQASFGLFFVDGQVPNTVREMSNYKWANASKKALESLDGKERPRKKDDHCCLVAGTLILMADGTEKPIEKVVEGDAVATHIGPCRVTASGQTPGTHDVIKTSIGVSHLIGTYSHEVLTNKGMKCISGLRLFDEVYTCQNDLLPLMEQDTIGTGSITRRAGQKNDASMLPCGNQQTGQFQTDSMFTIVMETGKTTVWKTLPSWKDQNTCHTTVWSHGRIRKDAPGGWNVLLNYVRKLLSGTDQKKAESGMQNTPEKSQKISLTSGEYVSIAVLNIKQRDQRHPGFVLAHVKWHLQGRLDNTTKQENAPFAEARFLYINLEGKNTVPVNALEKLEGKQRVYNLTVENAHCYYANGVLVSNCDSERYVVMSRPKTLVERVLLHDPRQGYTMDDYWAMMDGRTRQDRYDEMIGG